jgi:L-iditol 2-dehydrogenase
MTVYGSAKLGSLMRALVSNGESVDLQTSVAAPQPTANDVVIQVCAVGLCRTDLYAVAGKISARNSVIPGHEFAGTDAAVGTDVRTVRVGQRVTVNPLIPCGACIDCVEDRTDDCRAVEFLGVDLDGACAELVAVPESSVLAIPNTLSWHVAAFTEPVAASLAVLKADISPQQHGLIFGDGRIDESSRLGIRPL